MILGVWEKLGEISEVAKDWVLAHQSDPAFWIGLVILGLLVFSVTYNELHKEK